MSLLNDHWLVFNPSRGVTGCHCGFVADNDIDCGWGDGTIRHMMELAWDEGADFSSVQPNPYRSEE